MIAIQVLWLPKQELTINKVKVKGPTAFSLSFSAKAKFTGGNAATINLILVDAPRNAQAIIETNNNIKCHTIADSLSSAKSVPPKEVDSQKSFSSSARLVPVTKSTNPLTVLFTSANCSRVSSYCLRAISVCFSNNSAESSEIYPFCL